MAKPTPLPKLDSKTRIRDAAVPVLAARMADVRKYEAAVNQPSPDADSVHDMRVATRRLRVAMKLLKLPEMLDDDVKRLQDALGAVRDVNVQAGWIRLAGRRMSRADRALLAKVRARLEARLAGLISVLHTEVTRWRPTVEQIDRASRDVVSSRKLGGAHYRERIRKRLARVLDGFRALEKSDDATTAHRLRISVKKVRYEAELLEQVWPKIIGKLLAQLIPLQELLGDLHDTDVRIALIEQQIGQTPNADGALRLLAARERIARQRFATVLAREKSAAGLVSDSRHRLAN